MLVPVPASKKEKTKRQPKGKEKKERKKTENPREGWGEDGTPPPHRDFKERGVMR